MDKFFSKLFIYAMFFLIVCIYFNYEVPIETTSNNVTVFIDAGHGGKDGGAVGNDGTLEKTLDLQIALKLKSSLESCGIKVLMTRSGDYDLADVKSKNRKTEDIHRRVEMINSSNALLFISIHANAYPSSKVYGAQVFYGKKESQIISDIIQTSLINNLKNTKRKASLIKEKYILDETKIIGCIVEVGFLSNPNELKLLKSDQYQVLIVEAIKQGILEYLNIKN